MRKLLFFSLTLAAAGSYAQAPVVQKIEPLNTFPGDTVVITGQGFSTNAADLQVWFEGVKGQVLESTDYSILAIVPEEAKFGPVLVVNTVSRLSGRSGDKFMPSFPLESVDGAKFTQSVSVNSNEEFWDLCTCDLNSDGKPDIATTKFKRTSPFVTPTDIMVLNNTSTPGTISFTRLDKTNLPVLNLTFPTDNIVCGDLNGDAKPELVATRGFGNRNSIHIFRNTSTGVINFAAPTNLFMDVGHFATRLGLRDLNRDGKPEIIATNAFNDIFYIYINTSTAGNISFSGTPLKMSISTTSGETLTTYETDVQDFNGDNLPDIIINQFQTDNFYIFRNESSGSVNFGPPQKFNLQGSLNRLVSADFNKDGKLDILFTNTLDDKAYVLLNQSTASTFAFSAPITLTTSFEPWGVDLYDIDGDSDVDIVISNRNRPVPVASEMELNIFLNDGNATPSFTRTDVATTQPARNVRVTDFDGDSKPDLAFTTFDEAAVSSRVTILRNTNCHEPVILNPGPLTICNGQTIRLETIPANNIVYTWKQGAATVGSDLPYLDITTPGTYTVTATSEGGNCAVTSAQVTVSADAANAPAKPEIVHDAGDAICAGSTLHLSTTAVADSYTWSGPGFSATTQAASVVVSSQNAGLYTLSVKVGACNSPEDVEQIDVVDLTDFTISSNATSEVMCAGSTVQLSVNDLDGYSFQWELDNAAIGGQTNAVLSATTSGAYTVVVTPPGNINCPVLETDPYDLSFLALPEASFTVDATACVAEELAFTNTSTTDPDGTALFTWDFKDTGTSTEENPSHAYATAGARTPSLTVRYDGIPGCQDSFTGSVQVVTAVAPTIEASAPDACPEDEVTLSIDASFASATWSTTETTHSISVTPGAYTVTTTDANGCTAEGAIEILAKEAPALTVSADPAEIPAGATSQLTADGADTYEWAPDPTLSATNIPNPEARPLQTTTYTVTGTTDDACSATAQVTVTIKGVLGFPVAFSPNGDGQNEIWDIQATFNPECSVSIFDGRGRRVFEGRGENWDGTYQGKPVPEGTYFYVYGCPDAKPLTGSVLLFR